MFLIFKHPTPTHLRNDIWNGASAPNNEIELDEGHMDAT
jgi:hypothetical protein